MILIASGPGFFENLSAGNQSGINAAHLLNDRQFNLWAAINTGAANTVAVPTAAALLPESMAIIANPNIYA